LIEDIKARFAAR